MTEDCYLNGITLKGVGRLIANRIILRFQEGSLIYRVKLEVNKTEPRWFDTTVDIKFEWFGTKRAVQLYTIAANDYLKHIRGLL